MRQVVMAIPESKFRLIQDLDLSHLGPPSSRHFKSTDLLSSQKPYISHVREGSELQNLSTPSAANFEKKIDFPVHQNRKDSINTDSFKYSNAFTTPSNVGNHVRSQVMPESDVNFFAIVKVKLFTC